MTDQQRAREIVRQLNSLTWQARTEDSEVEIIASALAAVREETEHAAARAVLRVEMQAHGVREEGRKERARLSERQPISDAEARDLQQTMDGAKWANAFCRATGFPDEGWALSWFCNAIMAGYDEAKRRAEAEADLATLRTERDRLREALKAIQANVDLDTRAWTPAERAAVNAALTRDDAVLEQA